jgi:hypothetical protein
MVWDALVAIVDILSFMPCTGNDNSQDRRGETAATGSASSGSVPSIAKRE